MDVAKIVKRQRDMILLEHGFNIKIQKNNILHIFLHNKTLRNSFYIKMQSKS